MYFGRGVFESIVYLITLNEIINSIVHGDGFAGTIQAFVPNDILDGYKDMIEAIFGKNSCYILNIRPVGGYALNL